MAKKSRPRSNRKKQSSRGTTKKARPTPAAAVTAADPDWKLFVEEFKDEHPELIESAIYALPQRLIDTIQDRIHGFFSEQEATFERNLARLGGGGFFRAEPFGRRWWLVGRPEALDSVSDYRLWKERYESFGLRLCRTRGHSDQIHPVFAEPSKWPRRFSALQPDVWIVLDDRHGRPRLVFRRLVVPLAYPFQLPTDVAAWDRQQRDGDHQRPQAELEAAAG
jgi:hypothetical protein